MAFLSLRQPCLFYLNCISFPGALLSSANAQNNTSLPSIAISSKNHVLDCFAFWQRLFFLCIGHCGFLLAWHLCSGSLCSRAPGYLCNHLPCSEMNGSSDAVSCHLKQWLLKGAHFPGWPIIRLYIWEHCRALSTV